MAEPINACNETAAAFDMDHVKIDPAWALRIPPSLAVRRKVLPFAAIEGRVHVACASDDGAAMQAVQRYVGLPVCPQVAESASLERALDRIFGHPSMRQSGVPLRSGQIDTKKSADPDSDDAVGLCDELLYAAMIRQASDIHIDPAHDSVHVRFRVDGVLESYRQIPKAAHSGLISRFKVLAGMDIAEKRAPQDGRFTHPSGGHGQQLDVRTATLPTRFGERMTLRLLASHSQALTLEKLGMSPHDLASFQQAIDKPHGLILLTGPTGSGKSTTLYAALRRLIDQQPLNVITIEDPIEYEMPGIAQVEVDTADKVSFGKALRSVLRHDPDVVMIGEIRDRDTVDIALKAALTGHLVLSTLHTNSAVSTVTRLENMGVPRYLIAATLRLAVAQRLVRRICARCRRPRLLEAGEADAMGLPHCAGRTVYEPAGCIYCARRGYVGRIALFESMAVDERLAREIASATCEDQLLSKLRERKMPRLAGDAMQKLLAGETTVQEVLAAVVDR
jgi:type IV pilus assembly protein PilB